ncbi:UNVERIFIED_CONTAM: hypothetical protein Slati_4292500 [Sesamum latifolium]|uniref:Uncharacterized protein n=1 Tax=Sesamum latifolium TaxID=2727402 RepID=A0AAW2TFZ6_9LAMI
MGDRRFDPDQFGAACGNSDKSTHVLEMEGTFRRDHTFGGSEETPQRQGDLREDNYLNNKRF